MSRSHRNSVLLPSMLAALAGFAMETHLGQHSMKVNSPIFNQISGKLGGAVGMTSRFGMQLRGLVTPSNPETPAQFLIRGALASLTETWRNTLTALQRAAWENLADDTPGGNSGFNIYVKVNMPRFRALQLPTPMSGVTLVATPPASLTTDFPAPSSVALDVSSSNCQFTLPAADTYAYQAAGGGILVSVTREQPSTRNTRIHPYKLWGGKNGVAATGALTLPLPADVALVAGRVAYVSFQAFASDGALGPVNVQRITVQA